MRALAVATAQRIPMIPDTPTLAEAGLTDFSYDSWFGLMAPAGTPPAIIEKINRETIAILQQPELQERLARQGGVTVVYSAPAQFDEIIKNDSARYGQIFKEAGSQRTKQSMMVADDRSGSWHNLCAGSA